MKAGDHICITKGGLSEHAVDVGDRTVLHFVKGEGVRRSRLDLLATGGGKVEVVMHRARVFPPKQVVARAFSRASNSAYAAMFPDSQGFASWCKTGKMPARAMDLPPAAARRLIGREPPLRSAAPRATRAVAVKEVPQRSKAPARPRAAAKKPGKAARAPRLKAARSATKAPSAKTTASKSSARGAKRTPAVKVTAARKPARTTKPTAKSPGRAQARKRRAPPPAKPPKRAASGKVAAKPRKRS